MSAPSDHLPKRRRRFRWQFGLRTLLGLMLLACVAFAYLAHYRREYQREFEREQPAIKAIAEIGGSCEMSADAPTLARWLAGDKTSRVVAVDLTNKVLAIGCGPQGSIVQTSLHGRVTDDWLRCLAPLEHLETLDLSGNTIGGEGLAALRGLKRLKTLDLTTCAIEDRDLADVASLPRLQTLRLGGANIGNEGLRHLAAITTLVDLHVGLTYESRSSDDETEATSVTMKPTIDGLRHLQALRHLEKLRLDRAQLSEAGMEVLGSLPLLRELNIESSRLTPRAIDRLREFPSLRALRFSRSELREETTAIAELKKARPDLTIGSDSRVLLSRRGSPITEVDETSAAPAEIAAGSRLLPAPPPNRVRGPFPPPPPPPPCVSVGRVPCRTLFPC